MLAWKISKKLFWPVRPDECIQQLQVYVDLGVTYFMLFFADIPKLDGLKSFAKDVISKFG